MKVSRKVLISVKSGWTIGTHHGLFQELSLKKNKFCKSENVENVMQGPYRAYWGADSVKNVDGNSFLKGLHFLYTINAADANAGHQLKIKTWCTSMVLKNINPPQSHFNVMKYIMEYTNANSHILHILPRHNAVSCLGSPWMLCERCEPGEITMLYLTLQGCSYRPECA